MSAQPKLEFAWETISGALASGIEDLLAFNWEEVTAGHDLPPFEMDYPAYLMLERTGRYRGVAARSNGKLIGYAGFFIQNPLRHKSSLWAMNDALYIDSEHRKFGTGPKLIAACEPMLKSIGCAFITQGTMEPPAGLSTAKPRATFADVLTRQGYVLMDRVHVKRL